jgi:4-amino-4-deoxychorismate mutase
VSDLASFRSRIDACDDRLVAVLAERLAICDEVAAWKAATGTPVMQPTRVDEVKSGGAMRARRHGLAPEFVERLYSLIIDEACRREDDTIRRLRAHR